MQDFGWECEMANWLRIEPKMIDFVIKLLVRKRLGCGGKWVEKLKRHRWLKHIDWYDVLAAALSTSSFAEDRGNYQDYPEELWWEVVEVDREIVSTVLGLPYIWHIADSGLECWVILRLKIMVMWTFWIQISCKHLQWICQTGIRQWKVNYN